MEYFAISEGIPVHIKDSDRGGEKGLRAIVLLHGYLETFYIWSEFFELLEKDYRVIAIDLPGHGLSGNAPSDANGEQVNTMEFDAGVVKGVLDRSSITKAYIAGHSLGGFVALECCRLYPDTFEKLILFNSHPFPEKEEDIITRNREIAIIEAGKMGAIASISIPKMYSRDNLRRLDDKISETIELCETHDPEGIIASIKGMHIRNDMHSFLYSMTIPVMLVTGEEDTIVTPEMISLIRSGNPSIKCIILEKCAHNSFVENCEESYKLTCEFLG